MADFHEIAGYEVMSTLGYGARSTIFAVRDRRANVFALKRVVRTGPSDQRFLDQAILEHDIASKFDHESLRRSFKLIRQRNFIRTSEVLVVMEFVDGVTLEQHQPPTLADLVEDCRQVAEGLHAMHQAGYVHADIKPNNIMVTGAGKVKIIDFGQSCPLGTVKERIQGTPDYIAPEQVRRRAITAQTDVFNLGATLYWLLTHRHVPTLIPKGKAGVTIRTEERCVPPIELNEQVSPALNSLVMDCVQTEVQDRPEGMQQVISRLEIAAAQIRRMNGEGAAPADVRPVRDDD